MEALTSYFTDKKKEDEVQVQFWNNPERSGWLLKQGEYIKTWRRRWFVLKEGHIFWFKENYLSRNSKPRGVILVRNCLTVKGAEDVLNKQFAFELSTSKETMYFIADTDKVLCRPLWQLLSHFPHLPVLESFLFLFVSLSEL
jgi:hypothetical protein